MSLRVCLLPEARVELLDARAWYDGQRDGLGLELLGCVEAAVATAARAPSLWCTSPFDACW